MLRTTQVLQFVLWKQRFYLCVLRTETALDEIKLLKCVRETDENDALRERTGLNFSIMRCVDTDQPYSCSDAAGRLQDIRSERNPRVHGV